MTPICRVCGGPCGRDAEVMYYLASGKPIGLCSPRCWRAWDDRKQLVPVLTGEDRLNPEPGVVSVSAADRGRGEGESAPASRST